ncbi:hypothetical protein JOD82_003520 [Paenibacillus sp. 1182]|nr:hypothetical protein [Paenibacillus sp. 1182]
MKPGNPFFSRCNTLGGNMMVLIPTKPLEL